MKPNRFTLQLNKASDAGRALPRILIKQIKNIQGLPVRPKVYYFIPGSNWATDWVGKYIVGSLQSEGRPIELTTFPWLLRDEIIHFDALGTFVARSSPSFTQKNRLILTIFHGFSANDSHDNNNEQANKLIHNVEQFIARQNEVDLIVTASTLMKKRMIRWGIPAEKIIFIPLGIDLKKFHPVSTQKKAALRKELGIPLDSFVVGSFQKDGAGWEEGLIPKHIKGPDCFVDVVKGLKKDIPNLFVLLTGPARGFVKNGLSKVGVPFLHHVIEDFGQIPRYYQALDCYLVASREEGGPKAILEAQASGIPLVTTEVGLVADVVTDQLNGLITSVEDISALITSVLKIARDPQLKNQLADQGTLNAQEYCWEKIASLYDQQVYQSLLANFQT